MVKAKTRHQRFVSIVKNACFCFGLGVLPIILEPQPVLSAERITTFAGSVQISISVDSLEDYLESKLARPGGVQVVKLASNLENRYQLVQQDRVHLECGPNTIRSDIKEVTFSQPFFATGTKFLLKSDRAKGFQRNSDFKNLTIGVLKDTTTEQFVEIQYPKLEKIYFAGNEARFMAIEALNNNSIDALVSDSILSTQEIQRQGLASNDYVLLPQQPLTCDYYGILLPEDDRQWRNTINSFLHSQSLKQTKSKWLAGFSAEILSAVNYCNQQR